MYTTSSSTTCPEDSVPIQQSSLLTSGNDHASDDTVAANTEIIISSAEKVHVSTSEEDDLFSSYVKVNFVTDSSDSETVRSDAESISESKIISKSLTETATSTDRSLKEPSTFERQSSITATSRTDSMITCERNGTTNKDDKTTTQSCPYSEELICGSCSSCGISNLDELDSHPNVASKQNDDAPKEEDPHEPEQPTIGIMQMLRKASVAVTGTALVVAGIPMIPFPTPGGLLVTGSGMALLATEFPAAQRVLDKSRDGLERFVANVDDDDSDKNHNEEDNHESKKSKNSAEERPPVDESRLVKMMKPAQNAGKLTKNSLKRLVKGTVLPVMKRITTEKEGTTSTTL